MTSTSAERAAAAGGHHPEIVPRRRTPAGLFAAEHAYAVRLVQIATATSDRRAVAELESYERAAAGMVPCAAHENGG